MKKFITFSIGALLLSTTFIVASEASRSAYHTSFIQKQNSKTAQKARPEGKRRSFTRRLYAFKQSETTNPISSMVATQKRNKVQRRKRATLSRFINTNKINITARYKDWRKKVSRTGVFKKVDRSKNLTLETFQNDLFSINLLQTVVEDTSKVGHFLQTKDKAFTVSIKRFKNECAPFSLNPCAIALSKTENNKQKLYVSSKIRRQSRVLNTVLNSEKATPTFTEGFEATLNGEQQLVVYRHFVSDLYGGIFEIEVQFDKRFKKTYDLVAKQIFDSFRLYDL